MLFVWVLRIDLFFGGVVGIELGFVCGPGTVLFYWGGSKLT